MVTHAKRWHILECGAEVFKFDPDFQEYIDFSDVLSGTHNFLDPLSENHGRKVGNE